MSPDSPPAATDLRRRAEAALPSHLPPAGAPLSLIDAQRLLHELQVHQIELEMQNDELQQAHDALAAAAAHYTDLYDLAPVGYVTLDRGGAVVEANLAAARLLGSVRAELVGRRLALFVADGDRRAFNDCMAGAFAAEVQRRCEVLLEDNGMPRAVGVEATRSENGATCRVVLHNITDRRAAQAQLAGQVQVLQARNDELDRFNRAMIDRELRMLELKAQVNALHARLGEPARYAAPADAPSGPAGHCA